MRTRSTVAALVVVAVLGWASGPQSGASAAPDQAPNVFHAVDGETGDWPGEPTWVPGTAAYDAGV